MIVIHRRRFQGILCRLLLMLRGLDSMNSQTLLDKPLQIYLHSPNLCIDLQNHLALRHFHVIRTVVDSTENYRYSLENESKSALLLVHHRFLESS